MLEEHNNDRRIQLPLRVLKLSSSFITVMVTKDRKKEKTKVQGPVCLGLFKKVGEEIKGTQSCSQIHNLAY